MQEGLPQALRDAKQAQLDALSGNKSGLMLEKRAKKYDRIYKSVVFIGALLRPYLPPVLESRSPARAQTQAAAWLWAVGLRCLEHVEGKYVRGSTAEAQP